MRNFFYRLVVTLGFLVTIGVLNKAISAPDSNVSATLFLSAIAVGGSTITVECANSQSLLESDCVLWNDPKYKTPVKFLNLRENQSYLTRLIKESASKTGPRSGVSADFPILALDTALLKNIADGKTPCFADEKMADLLVACPISEREQKTLILFMRGLCDRCEFEPIVLKAEQKK